MSSLFVVAAETGRTLFGTLQQITSNGVPGNYWSVTLGQWASSVPINDRKVTLTEGGLNDLSRYTGGTGALGTYSGYALKQIHDQNQSNRVIGIDIIWLSSGVEQRNSIASDLSALPLATWSTINSQGGVLSSNMRGTDAAMLAASYVAPDNANIAAGAASAATAASQSTTAATSAGLAQIAAQAVEGRLTVGRAANLDNLNATVSSRSTLTAADVKSHIDANGGVVASNMRGTDSALLAASYVAADNANITVAATQATAAATAAGNVDTRLTATRAGYLDNLSGGAVALQTTVAAITNTTRAKLVAPAEAQIPAAGSRVFTVDLLLYDTAGNMETPDGTPTIAAANESGVDRSANLSAVSTIGTGHYRATYTVATSHAEEQIVLTWTAVEGGQSLKATHMMTVVGISSGGGFTTADRSKLETMFNKLPSKPYLVGTNATDGDIDLDQLEGNRGAFMADVSALATAASITALPASVVTYANANGGIVSSNMRGTDNAMLASGYTAPDNANIAAAASSAATAASGASTAATQATAAASAAQTVEGRLTTGRAANLDNLDALISSRSDFDPLTDTVVLAAGQGLATAADLAAVKAKTDLLPAQPAATSDIPTASQIAVQVDSTLTTSHGAGSWSGGGGDATEAKQDAILAAVALVNPAPPSPTQIVSKQRTWRLYNDGEDSLAPQLIYLPAGTAGRLAMDFEGLLNPGTGVAGITSITDLSGEGLVPTNAAPSQDRMQAHFNVTGLTAGKRYELRVTVSTSDGQTLSGRGQLRVE